MAEQNASITGSSEDYYINGSSNGSSGVHYEDEWSHSLIFMIISAIEIPIMILTLFALCALIKSHR
ncbi:hypothetical protein PO909_030106, partial [Leuciscus waleckii]